MGLHYFRFGLLALNVEPVRRVEREWSEDDYDVLCEGAVVGSIMKAARRRGIREIWPCPIYLIFVEKIAF